MINQGNVESFMVNAMNQGKFQAQDAIFGRECCAFINSHCSNSLSGKKTHLYAYQKKSKMSPFFRDEKNIKAWEFICNEAGFNWEFCGVNPPTSVTDEHEWFRFKIDTSVHQFYRHSLMVFSTIRYMYSPLYHVIPEKAVEFYKDNNGNIPDPLGLIMMSHVFRSGYNNYYGLNHHRYSYLQSAESLKKRISQLSKISDPSSINCLMNGGISLQLQEEIGNHSGSSTSDVHQDNLIKIYLLVDGDVEEYNKLAKKYAKNNNASVMESVHKELKEKTIKFKAESWLKLDQTQSYSFPQMEPQLG